ncbi:hypothetical protein PFISCL1PPCAC_13686, partial [Pristionchus fissidentatus]
IPGEPVFLYVFEHFTPEIMGIVGKFLPLQEATHTCELFYLFKKSLFVDISITETESRVINLYTTAITNFAKYGNPNGFDNSKSELPVHWDAVDRQNYGQNYVFTSNIPLMKNKLFEMTPTTYPDSRVVETSYGKVQGRRLIYEGAKQVDAFQGIPFASPPVGELRFKKPVPPACWNGIKETKKFAARSLQGPRNPEDYEMNGIPSEDSLYLNVFTPCWKAPEEGFPVIVFIHGGAFIAGQASDYGDIGICENIVSRDIVFVTIQYRLGYLGYFTTGDAECPGNFGLWDQVEALKWVQMNIEAFGGNKNNVTLGGQSAGAASVDMLHLSPHSAGLFHKAICMAGTAECAWA